MLGLYLRMLQVSVIIDPRFGIYRIDEQHPCPCTKKEEEQTIIESHKPEIAKMTFSLGLLDCTTQTTMPLTLLEPMKR